MTDPRYYQPRPPTHPSGKRYRRPPEAATGTGAEGRVGFPRAGTRVPSHLSHPLRPSRGTPDGVRGGTSRRESWAQAETQRPLEIPATPPDSAPGSRLGSGRGAFQGSDRVGRGVAARGRYREGWGRGALGSRHAPARSTGLRAARFSGDVGRRGLEPPRHSPPSRGPAARHRHRPTAKDRNLQESVEQLRPRRNREAREA